MSTEFSVRKILVVPAALRGTLNEVAATIDTVGGAQTFSVGLSATGAEPATHYVCNVALRQTTWAYVEAELAPAFAEVQVYDGQVVSIDDVLAELELMPVESGD